MARDYAKRGKQSSQRSKAPSRKKAAPRQKNQGWRWYGAGVTTGVFFSFLLYLGTLPTTVEVGAESPPPQVEQAPKPRFDFYTLLPEQSLEVPEKRPADTAPKPAAAVATAGAHYLLQAGSFKQREDADRRRAELLLLGLSPKVEQASRDSGSWFRVYLGPFSSREMLNSARGLTAAQNIETLLLKRSKP